MTHLAIILLQNDLAPWQEVMSTFLTEGGMPVLGTWIAAGLTLCMLSFVYKDNPFFRFGEHLYLGISAAYVMTIYWFNFLKPKFVYPLIPVLDPHYGTPEGTSLNLWIIVPGILGVFILMRLIPGQGWFSRITFAFYIGGFTGVALPRIFAGFLLPQFFATMEAIPWRVNSIDSAVLLLNSLILFIGALSVLVYFFFSMEHRGFIGRVSRVGIYMLMIAFGASFGYTIMARVSLLIGRMQFLMFDWIGEEIVARIASLFHGG